MTSDAKRGEPQLDAAYYLDVLLHRRWVAAAVFAAIFTGACLYAFLTKPVYRAGSLLVIEKERGGSAVTSNGALIESSNEDYYQTQYKLLKSQSLLQLVYDRLDLGATADFAQPRGPRKLEQAVLINPVLRSRLVYVNVESHDPQLAARVTNALCEIFVEQNLSNQLFISKEVLQALSAKRADISEEKTYAALPAIVNNQLIQQLKAEYAKLQAQYANMSSRYTPKHPAIAALRSDMAAIDGQIKVETGRIVQSVKTELSGRLKGNNVRIVDPAQIPDRPIRPKKTFALVMGLLAGLSCALGAAFLIEKIDQSIRTQEDVERSLGLPFLGLIPFSLERKNAVYASLLAQEPSLSSEAVRSLRTMVDFADVGRNAKAFLVTSSIQGEGKSYIAANLAVAFSQLNENVLLIGGDLRRPSVQKNFRVASPGDRGLSDFLLKGQHERELEDLLCPSGIPGLKLLLSGHLPPSPSELLNTPRLGAVMAWAKANFDRIIVDCTPMFPIHDTFLWGRHVSAAVFVVRYGKTRTPLVHSACQRLSKSGVKIFGVAVNAAKLSGLAYSSYGRYYQDYRQAASKNKVERQEAAG